MQRAKKILQILLPVLFWFAVWEIAAWRIGKALLFPPPRAVFQALWEMIKTEGFYKATGRSLWNVLSGILSATAIGIVLAMITHRVRLIRELILPLMTMIKATPVASFIVLLLIWIGSVRVPSVITFLIVLPVIWTNLDEGLRRQDEKLLQVAHVYGFSRWKTLRILTIPSVKPYFISACRTSLGLAWKAGIAAEIIANPRGTIGTKIGEAKQYLNTEEMFAWTLTVIVLSLLLEFGAVALLNRWERMPTTKEDAVC